MGTIAEKLTYLNTTKQNIKEMIGYGYSGINSKNLLDIENYIQSPTHGITTVYNNDGSITISGTATDTYAFITTKIPIDLTGNFTFSIQEPLTYDIVFGTYSSGGGTVSRELNAGDTSKTITCNGDTGVRIKLENLTVNTTYNNTIYLQLEEGSTATPFEKYVDTERFRSYPDYIKEAFLEALRTPDTLFTNLPKKSGSGAVISLNDTANAPMRIELGASELTQASTPTPSSPQDIHTISGSNTIVINGKNLLPVNSNYSFTRYNLIELDTPIPAGDYYISWNSASSSSTNTQSRINLVYTDDSVSSGIDLYYSSLGKTITFSKDVKEIRCYAYGDYSNSAGITATFNNLMLEVGNQATTYTPYTSQEADIDLSSTNLAQPNWAVDFVSTIGSLSTNLITRKDNRNCVKWTAGAGYGSYDTKNLTLGITFKENTQYTLSCDVLKENASNGTIAFYYTDGTTSVISGNSTTDTWEHKTLTSTSGKSVKYIAPYYSSGNTYADLDTWQIVEGTTELPYVPYYTPIEYCKIGNYEDKFIRNSGKNLFDKDNANVLDAYIGNSRMTSADGEKTIYIPCKPNTTYTLQKMLSPTSSSNRFRVACSEVTPTTSSTVQNVYTTSAGTSVVQYTYTTTSSAKYLLFYCYYTDNSLTFEQMLDGVMINEGSTALPYEPYGTNEWYIKKNIGKVVLDGSEDWQYLGQYNNNYGYNIVLTNLINTGNIHNLGLTNYLHYTSGPSVSTDGSYYFAAGRIVIFFANISSVADLKTWLSTHNTTVYYVLATPTYTKITGTLANQLENVYQKLLSYDGTTNISQINNDLSFNMSIQAIEK